MGVICLGGCDFAPSLETIRADQARREKESEEYHTEVSKQRIDRVPDATED